MKVFNSPEEAAGKLQNTVVTTGSFDGVHIGHKVIINRLNELAKSIDGESCLVTFYPHPRKVLYPDQVDLKLINSQEEKIELLSKTGLDNLVVIPFSVGFSKTTSHQFISRILIGQLNAKIIIVGHNHHFGHKRSGDYSYLNELSRELGFQVENIPLKDIENETVSSTKIRKALSEGNIMRANAYLDHQYIITGKLNTSGQQIGGSDSYTISIEEPEKVIPPPGIYATNTVVDGKSLKSMTLISDVNGQRLVQNTLIHDRIELNELKAITFFHKKIRGAEIFYNSHHPDEDEIMEAREDIEELIY